MAFAWAPDLSVGVESIDAQHRELMARANALLEASQLGQGRQAALDTLLFLSDYVAQHFEDEERLMEEEGFPGLELHRAEHARFRVTLRSLVHRFSTTGADRALGSAVEQEVCAWIQGHVLATDRELGRHVRSRRAG